MDSMTLKIKVSPRILFCGLFLILFLCQLLWGNSIVNAQTAEPPPQKVIANNHVIISGSDCEGQSADLLLEVWNVGAAGGDQYSAATVTATGYDCINGKLGTTFKTSHYVGTFSGGPNGSAKLKIVLSDEDKKFITNPEYINHEYVLQFEGGLRVSGGFIGEFIVQNPEAFNGAAPPSQVTPTPGKSCSPSVGGLSGLKPGDTLSPSVEFSDSEGKPVAPLSAVWYINGKQTYSTTWDGKETALELQYTCPDNSAHSQNYTVPAYTPDQSPTLPADQPPTVQPPADQPEPSTATAPPGNVNPVAVAAGLVIGLIGIVGVVVAVVISKTLPPVPPSAPPPPTPLPAPPQPTPQPPQATPPPAIPPAQPPPAPEPLQPQPAPEPELTPEEKALRKGEMLAEIQNLREKYQTVKKEKEYLQRLLKQDLLKFLIKKTLEVKDWITLNPLEIGKKLGEELTPEKLRIMDKLFQKHDTSKDADIIQEIYKQIEIKKNEMHEIAREVYHLENEVQK